MRKLGQLIAATLALSCTSASAAPSPQASLVPRVEPARSPSLPNSQQDQAAQPLTAENVNAWLDGFFPYAIERGDVPGAVVVVVKDGRVLTERGFGYADVAKKIKVNPQTTLFRPGSVSKLFTWTALMQQVEQGKIDLNADVNRYIDFKIPPYQGKPITILNLMTHTPGFEEQGKDLITVGAKTQIPFDTLLKRWTPKRIYAPGTTPAYSNYGASLAGYIVQRVSGEPFDTYLQHHIFTPLGMSRSTFQQPLPANLKPLMAEGYESGKPQPYGFEFVNGAPAGALSATGDDMAKFMIAHLQNGEYNGARILQPQTAQLMHSRVNSPFSAGDGMTHGFYETSINGLHVISHAGDIEGFHSDLHLFLDKNVGLYVSLNGDGKDGAVAPIRDALFSEFADRYFPEPAGAVQKPDPNNARADAEKLAGIYSMTRGSRSNFLSILDLIGQAKISVDEHGNPLIAAVEGLNGQPRKWVHIGPMLWRDADGHDLLTANVSNGRANRFSFGELAPIIDFDRTPLYRSSGWILPLLYASLAVLLLTTLMWPIRALVRGKYNTSLGLEGSQLWAYRASRIAAIVILLTIIAWALSITKLLFDLAKMGTFDALLVPLELLSIISFVGGLAAMIWYAWTAWRSGWRWPGKVYSLILVFACAMVLYVGVVFRLVALTANY